HHTESAGRGTLGRERRLEGPNRPARQGLQATGRPVLQGATQGPPQTPRAETGPRALHFPDPADPRPMDRPTHRGPTPRSGLLLLRRAVAGAPSRARRDHRSAPPAPARRAALSGLGLSLPRL